MFLKIRFGHRIRFDSFSVGWERGCSISISRAATVHFGTLTRIRKRTDLEAHEAARIEIGDHVFIGKDCMIVARARIRIGSKCLIGNSVSIYDHDHEHSMAGVAYRDQGFVSKPVVIGSNVWIGANCFIRAGIEIGDNAIVAAGTVVTENIPANHLAYRRASMVTRSLITRAISSGAIRGTT